MSEKVDMRNCIIFYLPKSHALHVCVCVCTDTHFKWCYHTCIDNVPPRTIGYLIKHSGLDMRYSLFQIIGLGCPRVSQNIIGRLLLLALVVSKRLKVSPHCWTQHVLQAQDSEDPSWIWPESLLSRNLLSLYQKVLCKLLREATQ